MSNELEIESQINSETSSNEADHDSPSSPLVYTGKIFRVQHGRKTIFQTSKPKKQSGEKSETAISAASNPIPLAYTLAFAHHMEMLISSGEVKDRAELARIFGLSRARVTQILNLILLAPDIQEEILFMQRCEESPRKSQIFTERALRKFSRVTEWEKQRKLKCDEKYVNK